MQTLGAHQPLHRAPGHRHAGAAQQVPTPCGSGHGCPWFGRCARPGSARSARRRGPSGLEPARSSSRSTCSGRSDSRAPSALCADRLDPEPFRWSSMDAATTAVAGRAHAPRTRRPPTRISLARFSSRTSCSSCLILAASPVVVPVRPPASMSACMDQARSVSAEIGLRVEHRQRGVGEKRVVEVGREQLSLPCGGVESLDSAPDQPGGW